ncbi:MAG: MarR family transcriptional regulator [Pseudomonadaceae bacterium]|nr:MarR family transcriptional regulator [Pseudomonadaceae bacterium]
MLDFLDAASVVERRLDGALSYTRGISFSEFRLLRTLALGNASGTSRVDLAHAVGLTPSAVTRALKPMEKLGYVQTVSNERDARQSLAQLTDGGRVLLKDAEGVFHDTFLSSPLNELNNAEVEAFQARLEELRRQ